MSLDQLLKRFFLKYPEILHFSDLALEINPNLCFDNLFFLIEKLSRVFQRYPEKQKI